MVIYLALLIPVIFSLFSYFTYKHKVTLWEVGIPILVTLLFILIAKWICINSLTIDTEYLGGYVIKTENYKEWDEEVSCRHPVYKEVCEGSGNDRKCHDELDHYEHSYDVDFHPEYWSVITTLGTYDVPKYKYDELVSKFKMKPIFKDLERDYHKIDGDMYYVYWPHDNLMLESVTIRHSYENRPMASSGVYHMQELDSFDLQNYRPFEYPEISNIYHQKLIMGYNDPIAEQKLQVVNALLGANKQVRIYFLIFDNIDREAGIIQQRYWQNGNKNEIVVCIGYKNNKIYWSHVFSWTEQVEVMINIRSHIETSKKFNLSEYVDVVESEVYKNWIRKPFKEFSYLEISPTDTQTIWIFALTFFINAGICVWMVMNEFED